MGVMRRKRRRRGVDCEGATEPNDEDSAQCEHKGGFVTRDPTIITATPAAIAIMPSRTAPDRRARRRTLTAISPIAMTPDAKAMLCRLATVRLVPCF